MNHPCKLCLVSVMCTEPCEKYYPELCILNSMPEYKRAMNYVENNSDKFCHLNLLVSNDLNPFGMKDDDYVKTCRIYSTFFVFTKVICTIETVTNLLLFIPMEQWNSIRMEFVIGMEINRL